MATTPRKKYKYLKRPPRQSVHIIDKIEYSENFVDQLVPRRVGVCQNSPDPIEGDPEAPSRGFRTCRGRDCVRPLHRGHHPTIRAPDARLPVNASNYAFDPQSAVISGFRFGACFSISLTVTLARPGRGCMNCSLAIRSWLCCWCAIAPLFSARFPIRCSLSTSDRIHVLLVFWSIGGRFVLVARTTAGSKGPGSGCRVTIVGDRLLVSAEFREVRPLYLGRCDVLVLWNHAFANHASVDDHEPEQIFRQNLLSALASA